MVKTLSILVSKSWTKLGPFSLRGAALSAALLLFLLAVELLSGVFRLLNQDLARELFTATSNPFVSLFVGLLAAAILQSSSTITTMLVAVVAAGKLDLDQAVPMVMGANIGTTITSTIVAMGHIANRNEFRKAIVAATMHDLFNIMVVALLFPLEYWFGLLTRCSAWGGTHLLAAGEGFWEVLAALQSPLRQTAQLGLAQVPPNWLWGVMVVAIGLLFWSIRLVVKVFNQLLVGNTRRWVREQLFEHPFKSLLWGCGLTAAVQSSSVTTSLVVPLVAKGKVEAKKAFSFLMGANLGTTATALLAASFASSEPSMSIALAHILFNLFGILLIFPIPAVRNLPVRAARLLGVATVRNRLTVFAYLVVTFFLLPFLLIYFNR
jgi:sodium-dependent phosphate cotransporter